MTRILIADDHEVVRSGLRSILEAQPNWEVVAEATDGKEAILKAIATKPDVAVLDYSLPVFNGVEATRQIRTRVPQTEVLVFTMHESETLMRDLLQAGARGYLLKSDAKQFLITAVQSLAAHKPFFTSRVSETLLEFVPDDHRGRPRNPHRARAHRGSAHRRGTHQQADRGRPQYQPEDRGDASGGGDAQAQPDLDRRRRQVRHPQSPGRAVMRLTSGTSRR